MTYNINTQQHPIQSGFNEKTTAQEIIKGTDLTGKQPFQQNITSLKVTEAISILREIDPDTDAVLTDPEEPGKLTWSDLWKKLYVQYAFGAVLIPDGQKFIHFQQKF
ncbi:hypothetical protein [Chryseobacterium oranimense]|uniref:hypothetical protein n=1 Tax=Chryseobacterium oranimense TaxID=421058 RepID=UPI000933B0A8|nr:hypothetical protein [Chryseobacterium oranimense]